MFWRSIRKYLLIWLVMWILLVGFVVISNGSFILSYMWGGLKTLFEGVVLIGIMLGGIVLMLRSVFS